MGRIITFALMLWPLLAGGQGQIFVLDFDTFYTGGATDHDYTLTERDEIVAEMHAHFNLLGMSATNAPPATGEYSTVFFNTSSAGTSDGVDFRNLEKDDNAHVNARMMLEIVGIDLGDQTSEQIVRASINIGMHEALHLLGARHQDAYTLPVQGLPPGSSPGDGYGPPYPGPRVATLTDQTFMSLTTLLGVTEEKLLSEDLFISPRTAMKALLGESVTPIAKVGGNHSPPASQILSTTLFAVPNTLPADLTLPDGVALPPGVSITDLVFFAEAAVVVGHTDPGDGFIETDYYGLPVASGWPYTIEVHSAVLDHRSGWTPTDVGTAALRPAPPTTLDYYGTGSFNYEGFELSDPALVDVLVPADLAGMLVDVFTPNVDGEPGDYELLIYRIGVEVPAELAIPALGLSRTNGSAVIEWVDLGADFDLQETSDMVVGDWTNSVAAPAFVPAPLFGRFTVSESIDAPWKFYRLMETEPPDP